MAHGFVSARQPLLHGLEQFLQRNRLFEKIQGADARCFDGRIDGGMPRHHDDRHGQQAIPLPLLEQRDTVGVRHPDVQQHQIRGSFGARLARLAGILRRDYRMSFIAQNFQEQLADAHFIINYQDICHVNLPSKKPQTSLSALSAKSCHCQIVHTHRQIALYDKATA